MVGWGGDGCSCVPVGVIKPLVHTEDVLGWSEIVETVAIRRSEESYGTGECFRSGDRIPTIRYSTRQ